MSLVGWTVLRTLRTLGSCQDVSLRGEKGREWPAALCMLEAMRGGATVQESTEITAEEVQLGRDSCMP